MANNNDGFVEVGIGETWKPEDEGDSIQGVYVAKQEDVGPNNSMLYTLETDEGNRDLWGSAVLDTKFRALKFGQEVRVEFLGLSKEKGKFGKPYKDWRVLAKPLKPEQFHEVDERVNLDDIQY